MSQLLLEGVTVFETLTREPLSEFACENNDDTEYKKLEFIIK